MTDVWYYAQGDKPVGPLTFNELKAMLSGISKPQDMLVWRAGFVDWIEAGNVAQLVPYLKVKTPSPPPLPVAIDRRDGAFVAVKSSDSKRRDRKGSIISVILIVIIVAGARYLSRSTEIISSPDPASVISGNERASFINEGITSCMKKQESDPDTKSLSLSREVLSNYCSCYMNALADKTTYGDLRGASTDRSVTPAMQAKIGAADASCADKMRRSLLGGR